MIIWPTTLPGPIIDKCTITPGSNIVRQTWMSGRSNNVKFGAGAPDTVKCIFRLFNSDVDTFKHFYARTSNMGTNWFTADWLAYLGYDSHAARIVGYPKRKFKGSVYSDYSVALDIKTQANVWGDTEWPSTPVDPPVPPVPTGLVVAWGDNEKGVLSVPANLYAVKVVCGKDYACALTAAGTLNVWGETTFFAGYESVGGIVDIAGGWQTVICLTESGSLVIVGRNNYGLYGAPLITDGIAVYANDVSALVVRENGVVMQWGSYTYQPSPSLFDPVWICGGLYEFLAVNQTGDLYVWGYDDSEHVLSDAPSMYNAKIGAITLHQGIVFDTNYVPTIWGDSQEMPPAGLQPKQIFVKFQAGLAIHNDDKVISWGSAELNNQWCGTIPTDLHAISIDASSYHAVAVEKEE